MKTLFKLFLVLSLAACGLGQNNDNADYWQDLYDSQWYDEEIEKLGLDSFELNNSKDIDGQQSNNKNEGTDELGHDEKNLDEDTSNFDEFQESNQSVENKIVDDILSQELKDFIPQNETQPEIKNVKSEDENDNDYVLEDNRSVSEEKTDVENNLTDENIKELKGDVADPLKEINLDKIDDYVIEDSRLLSKDEFESFDDLALQNEKNADVDDAESVNRELLSNKSQGQDSGEIINRVNNLDEQNSDDDKSEVDMDKDKSLQEAQEKNGTKQQNPDILEETKQLLESIESSFSNSDEDNVDKVNDDLDYDLKKLFETFDKLSQDAQNEIQKPLFDVDKPEKVHNEIADYEEKFQRPYNEESILKLRHDYEESLNNPEYWDDYQNSNENEHKDDNDARNDDEQNDMSIDEILKKLDEELEQDADDDIVRDEKVYENDALHANEDTNKADDSTEKQVINHSASNEGEIEIKEVADIPTEKYTEVHTNLVEELTSAELKSKIDELISTYADELDVTADGFDRNVAPVYITLKLDEAVEITSPDYPNFYPTNNIIDWIFEGDGMGIELNITDLSLNGFMGDYLLIKPGGMDHTGQDGLVFSFHLNSERRYRFLDVDRMFVRFRAHPGMQFGRGFKFSVKLVGPKLTLPEPIPTPTPEPVLPEETLTVFFEGLVVSEFRNRSEEFRSIIADMATLYINRHGIDPGYEPTINVTQITRIAECNINWPGHEPCAAVSFGVPLEYADEQDYRLTTDELEYMWLSYSSVDPYAARLRRMGISEFAIPNEGTVIMAWLVIFLGVFISALMLGFAIWRWNCFEGYSRMPLYNDTDSIISDKRKDDLYPTPHQNLPPLYSDGHFEDRWTSNADYKGAPSTQVDLSGYSNKNFMGDNELVYIDSDDDVIMSLPGQRNSTRDDGLTVTQKHVFEV